MREGTLPKTPTFRTARPLIVGGPGGGPCQFVRTRTIEAIADYGKRRLGSHITICGNSMHKISPTACSATKGGTER